MEKDPSLQAKKMFSAALKAVDPYNAVSRHVGSIRNILAALSVERVLIAGFGKAACPMAKAVEDLLQDVVDGGMVITKYGHCEQVRPAKITVREAGHPVPDEQGLSATNELVTALKGLDEKTLVVCLVSGGGSALLVSPCSGITLQQKQAVTDLLLRAGADIFELNAVRKHLSNVKGGRLAEIAAPSPIVSLMVSDVIGDPLDVIASGPTAPDRSSYGDALAVLEKYGLTGTVPGEVVEHLRRGSEGLLPETPKEGSPVFSDVRNIVIAGNKQAVRAAATEAESLGFRTVVSESPTTGEAREAARRLANRALRIKAENGGKPVCLISGGETTVRVKGTGKGGRNMELALAFALEVENIRGITLLSAGTDGTDGPTDAAGAIATARTTADARAIGLDPEVFLRENDSYTFFKKAGGLYVTGPTGTNVMDIQIILVQ